MERELIGRVMKEEDEEDEKVGYERLEIIIAAACVLTAIICTCIIYSAM